MIQLPSRKSKLDFARIDPVIRSGVESGKTYAYIAESLGVSYTTVWNRAVKHLGFTAHKKPEDWEILALLEQGMNFREASTKLGYNKKYITNTRCRDPEFKRLTDEARTFGKALNKEIAG